MQEEIINKYRKISSIIILLVILFVSLETLVFSQTWFHPEILGSSDYVWLYPGKENIFQMLRKSLDWKAFDPNVNRVRPINDLVEVIDAFSRPYFSIIPGIRSSVAISTIVLLILVPICYYKFLNTIQTDRWSNRIFVSIFISTIGFLSITVSYWHPAKRLSILFTIFALMAGSFWYKKGSTFWLKLGCLSVLLSSLSDETGIINFLIFPIIFYKKNNNRIRQLLYFILIPILFFIISKFLLPFIYSTWSVHGPWNALGDSKKISVFLYLFDLKFWECALIQTGRSISTSFGIWNQSIWITSLLLSIFLSISFVYIKFSHTNSFTFPLAVGFILSSLWATLLDWYPFPGQISYLGSFNYYYHSMTPVFLIAWLASIAEIFAGKRKVLFLLVFSLTIPMNFYQFSNINNVVRAIHQYPYTSDSIELAAQMGDPIYLTESPVEIEKQIENSLKNIFGNDWMNNGFYETHQMLKYSSLFTETHIKSLVHVIVPFKNNHNY